MKNKKVRLGRGSWERNGNLFESDYWLVASLLALNLDPTAIKQNRPYTNEDIDLVVKKLKVFYTGVPFTREKVKIYVNSHYRTINTDMELSRTRNYDAQLEQFRKGISLIK
jgi:hypothetical protein